MNREEMVPIELLVPHPKNPNKMSPEDFEKLKRHILVGMNYERIVVRTLELSKRKEDFAAGRMEILAGHHRFRILSENGHQKVACSIWEGVTDYKANLYLDTLNGLRGKPDATVRAELLKDILAESSIEQIEADLPDDSAMIRKLLALDPPQAASRTAASVIDSVPLTIFCGKEQAKIIEAAVAAWLQIHDPDAKLANREGTALVALIGKKEKP